MIIKRKSFKIFYLSLTFLLAFSWIFSSWPRIWQNPPIPPKIQEARAAFDERTETNVQGSTLSSPYQATLNVPTGTANGDLMFTWIGSYSATVTTNAAWTLIGSYTAASDKYYLYARVASSEPASYIWTFSGTSKYKATHTTYIASSDFNVTNVSTDLTVSNTSYRTSNAINRAASFSVPNTYSPILFFGGVYTTTVRTQTPPTNPGTFIEDYDAGSTTPDFSLEIAYYIWASSGISGNIDSTISATLTTKHAFAVALKPPAIVIPTVTTQAASSVEATTATGNGNITNVGYENANRRGFAYMVGTSGDPTTSDSVAYADGSFSTGAYTTDIISLSSGTNYRVRAYAINSAGTGYGTTVQILTKPAAPTGTSATNGDYTDKITITWTKSTGAVGYYVWRDSTNLGDKGDVAAFDDTGADAPIITPGTTVASDGSSTAQVDLNLSGTSANNGTTHTYKVVAWNSTGNSVDSNTDTGYRSVGSLTYQWQKSAADSDASYSNINNATSSTYNDTAAPAPTITPGTAAATDGSSTSYITLSISGESANNGVGRWYQAVLNATGAAQATSTSNRGYRGVGSLTYQWYRSSGDADSGFSSLSGATADPYNDSTAPAPTITPGAASASDGTTTAYVSLDVSGQSANSGAGRYFYATLNATGVSSQDTNHDRGYIGVGSLTYQWQRSAADSDTSYSNIDGATSASYNDTGAPSDGSGRYYKVIENATGATQQISTSDRGYKAIVSITISNNSVPFGYVNLDTTISNATGTIPLITVTSGPANLNIKSTNFTQGGNTWTLGATDNGINQVLWEFSKDNSSYSTFASPGAEYVFDTNVPDDGTRNVYLRITTPTDTAYYSQFGVTVTVVASAP